jgi:hypothetical protein
MEQIAQVYFGPVFIAKPYIQNLIRAEGEQDDQNKKFCSFYTVEDIEFWLKICLEKPHFFYSRTETNLAGTPPGSVHLFDCYVLYCLQPLGFSLDHFGHLQALHTLEVRVGRNDRLAWIFLHVGQVPDFLSLGGVCFLNLSIRVAVPICTMLVGLSDSH